MTQDQIDLLAQRIDAAASRIEDRLALLQTEFHALATRVTVLETRDNEIEGPNRVLVKELQKDMQTIKAWLKTVTAIAGAGFAGLLERVIDWLNR